MVDKTEWGPIVWKLLHTMADISKRKDIYLLWVSVLRSTAYVLPCELCRDHMKSYIQTHTFLPKNWMKQTGDQNCNQIRAWLHAFHNSVNERLTKPVLSLNEIPEKSFSEAAKEIQRQYQTLLGMWKNQRTGLREWKQNMELLIHLLLCGSD